jgi:hypothetical protein
MRIYQTMTESTDLDLFRSEFQSATLDMIYAVIPQTPIPPGQAIVTRQEYMLSKAEILSLNETAYQIRNARVNTPVLRIRETPGTTAKIVGSLTYNTPILVRLPGPVQDGHEWALIFSGPHAGHYVAKDLLSFQ